MLALYHCPNTGGCADASAGGRDSGSSAAVVQLYTVQGPLITLMHVNSVGALCEGPLALMFWIRIPLHRELAAGIFEFRLTLCARRARNHAPRANPVEAYEFVAAPCGAECVRNGAFIQTGRAMH